MYSQSGQDIFVSTLLNKQDGTFLDIGAGHPMNFNNTYVLETKYNWRGTSIDINPEFKRLWNAHRSNEFTCSNALTLDYNSLLKNNYVSTIIDYLSLDIDNRYVDVLQALPFDEYKFRVITIEHDYYIHGDVYRKGEREFLQSHGYQLVCSNVKNTGNMYEDWWVHPDLVQDYKYLICDELEYTDILERMSSISVLIFSKNRAMQLHALLQSIELLSNIYTNITILYTFSEEKYKRGYDLLKSRFSKYNFIQETDFERNVKDFIKNTNTRFISFLVDDAIFFKQVDKDKIINFLIQTDTAAFIPGVGTNTKFSNTASIEFELPDFTIENDICVWNWKEVKNKSEFSCPLMVVGNIFRTTLFNKLFSKIKIRFTNPNYFEEMLQFILQKQYIKLIPNYCGSFKNSCIVHSANNCVQSTHPNKSGQVFEYTSSTLNDKYLDGMIIDIKDYQFQNIIGLHHELDYKFKRYNN